MQLEAQPGSWWVWVGCHVGFDGGRWAAQPDRGWCHGPRRAPARGNRSRAGGENRQPLPLSPHRRTRPALGRYASPRAGQTAGRGPREAGRSSPSCWSPRRKGWCWGWDRPGGAQPQWPRPRPGPVPPAAASVAPYPLSPAFPAPPIVPRGGPDSTTRSASRRSGSSTSPRSTRSPRHVPSQVHGTDAVDQRRIAQRNHRS
jgi:hypothetical protein